MTISASNISFPQTIWEVSVQQAFAALEKNTDAVLVDVRTDAEWQVGVPDLSSANKKPMTLSWRTQPAMVLNTQFESQLMQQLPNHNTPIYFLCRSGGRSNDAANAMAKLGYLNCNNILGGFISWVETDLPWRKA